MITDATAIKYSNEQVRPMAETMRNLYYECKSMQTDWFNGINSVIPNETDNMLEDSRDSDNQLSGADINNIITQIGNYIIQIEQSGVLGIIQKPCIRSLQV